MLANALNGHTSMMYQKQLEVGLISEKSSGPRPVPEPGKRDTYFRSSSMGTGCVRAEAIKIVHGLEEDGVIDAKLSLLFAKGHAYHHMHQDILVPDAFPPNAVLGWWASPNGELSGEDSGRPKLYTRSHAIEMLGPDAKYVEPDCFDDEYCLSGHPDLIIDWAEVDSAAVEPSADDTDAREVVELKSRNGADYMWDLVCAESGGSPLPMHVLQVQSYMMMTGIRRARIIYLRKGDREFSKGLGSSMSEHVVLADDKYHDAIRHWLLKWRSGISAAHSEGEIPERERCSDIKKMPATRCACRYRCFGVSSSKDTLVKAT